LTVIYKGDITLTREMPSVPYNDKSKIRHICQDVRCDSIVPLFNKQIFPLNMRNMKILLKDKTLLPLTADIIFQYKMFSLINDVHSTIRIEESKTYKANSD